MVLQIDDIGAALDARGPDQARDLLYFAAGIIVFFVPAVAFVLLFRDDPTSIFRDRMLLMPIGLTLFLGSIKWFVPIFVALILAVPARERVQRVGTTLVAVLACSVFGGLFLMVKTTMVHAVPFYLDGPLEQIDRVLFFGMRPLDLASKFASWLSPHLVIFFYNIVWPGAAFYFPAILVLIDSDWPRRRLYYILFFFAYIFLGWICAQLGMSAGPVYHDYLVSPPRFGDFPDFLHYSGLDTTVLQKGQNGLWKLYADSDSGITSGISAFPSVHVAMATVVGLYVFDRWKMRVVAIAIPIWYLFLSVYTGWHYAVDGYFSIFAVWVFWYWLRARDRKAAVDRSGEAA